MEKSQRKGGFFLDLENTDGLPLIPESGGAGMQYSGHMGKKRNQNEIMVEICSKSLVRAIGKVLRMKFS